MIGLDEYYDRLEMEYQSIIDRLAAIENRASEIACEIDSILESFGLDTSCGEHDSLYALILERAEHELEEGF